MWVEAEAWKYVQEYDLWSLTATLRKELEIEYETGIHKHNPNKEQESITAWLKSMPTLQDVTKVQFRIYELRGWGKRYGSDWVIQGASLVDEKEEGEEKPDGSKDN